MLGRILVVEQQQQAAPPSGCDTDLDETRKKWLAAGFAAVAMTSYALLSGLVKVEITNVNEEDSGQVIADLPAGGERTSTECKAENTG